MTRCIWLSYRQSFGFKLKKDIVNTYGERLADKLIARCVHAGLWKKNPELDDEEDLWQSQLQ